MVYKAQYIYGDSTFANSYFSSKKSKDINAKCTLGNFNLDQV